MHVAFFHVPGLPHVLLVRVADRELGNLRRKSPAGVEFEVIEAPEEPYLMMDGDEFQFERLTDLDTSGDDPGNLAG